MNKIIIGGAASTSDLLEKMVRKNTGAAQSLGKSSPSINISEETVNNFECNKCGANNNVTKSGINSPKARHAQSNYLQPDSSAEKYDHLSTSPRRKRKPGKKESMSNMSHAAQSKAGKTV